MKLFKLRTYNALWLGGLRNITAGEEHMTRAVELPNIMRFFPLVKRNGKGACRGVFLMKEDTLYLPAPADIVGKRKKGGNWRLLKLVKNPFGDGSIEYLPLIKGTTEALESAQGHLIAQEDFENWWKENISENAQIKPISCFIRKELKPGLKLNKDKGTSEEKMLYFQERMRLLDDVSLVFLADNINEKRTAFGGEKNPAEVEEVNNDKALGLFEGEVSVSKGSIYRLYLTTHAYSEALERGKELTLKSDNTRLTFKVLWVYSAGAEFISGRSKEGITKPAVMMLKPGTVVVLEAEENGKINKLCQIDEKPSVKEIKGFLGSGWNSGILVEGGVEA